MDGEGRILVVDDDRDARGLIAEFLVGEGFAVETARDGRAAMQRLDRFDADLVVTDFEMPAMDGIELIRLVQESDTSRPALLLTGRSEAWIFQAVERLAGPVALLVKPVDLEQLAALARKMITARAMNGRVIGGRYAATH
jgi:CheY-like chemotaxis protein